MLPKLRILSFLLVVVLIGLAACGGNEATPPPAEPQAAVTAEAAPTAVVAVEEPAEREAESVEAPAEAESAESADQGGEMAAEDVGATRTFVIVPEETKASYIVAEEFLGGSLDRLGIDPGLVDTIGSTQQVEGQLELDLSDPALVGPNRFVVDIESLASDQPRRDDRIRTNNLESTTYPLAEFTITELVDFPADYSEGQEVSFMANGNMTIREITNPVSFQVTGALNGDTISGVAVADMRMTDYGFDPPNFANVFTVEDEFQVEVEFVLREQ